MTGIDVGSSLISGHHCPFPSILTPPVSDTLFHGSQQLDCPSGKPAAKPTCRTSAASRSLNSTSPLRTPPAAPSGPSYFDRLKLRRANATIKPYP